MSEITQASWSTRDEIKFIDFMINKSRGKFYATRKLNTWLKTAKLRIWPKTVDVGECTAYVYDKLEAL